MREYRFLCDSLFPFCDSAQFWADYWFDDQLLLIPPVERESYKKFEDQKRYAELEGNILSVPLAPGELMLSLMLDVGTVDLSIATAGGPVCQLGWDDCAHWHPHLLRWEELETICRYMALMDSRCSHPGVPLLLLHRFAPLCLETDVSAAFVNLEAAWRAVDLQPEPFIQWFRDTRDGRTPGWSWQFDSNIGWHLTEPEETYLYTLRRFDNGEFPWRCWQEFMTAVESGCHAAVRPAWVSTDVRCAAETIASGSDGGRERERLAKALREAQCNNPAILNACEPQAEAAQTAWIVETLLAAEIGVVTKNLKPASRIQPDITYEIQISVPMNSWKPLQVVTDGETLTFWKYLEMRLHESGVGMLTSQGAESRVLGFATSDLYTVSIRNDLEHGLAVLRSALQVASVPPNTKLSLVVNERLQDLPL